MIKLMIIVFVALLLNTGLNAQKNLAVKDFAAAINQKDVQVLDVRTAAEYNSGHISKTLQANWNDSAEFIKRVTALDKSKPVYTYCLSGARSNAAAAWLNANGYTAYNMDGGMMAWKKAGKPVEQAVAVAQLNMEDYKKMINSNSTVLVDFGATWCPPCVKMAPVLDSLATTAKGKYAIIKIDGSEQSALSEALNITVFPVFIVYKNGKEQWRKEGLSTAAELTAALK